MSRRIIGAKTTLARVDASAHGFDWVEEANALVDARAAEPLARVRLEIELDPSALEHVPHHAITARLTPDQARLLGETLLDAAGRVPDAEE
jgi:hypothetical protein